MNKNIMNKNLMIIICFLCSVMSVRVWAQENMPAPADNNLEFRAPPLEEFSTMIKRPLFSKQRRPVAVARENVERPKNKTSLKPVKTNFFLSGIIFDGEDYVALLKESRTSDALLLKKGQSIVGWKVEEIKAEEVWLVSGERTSRLSLRDNKLSDAEKQKITRMAHARKKLAQRKKLAESRKRLTENRRQLDHIRKK